MEKFKTDFTFILVFQCNAGFYHISPYCYIVGLFFIANASEDQINSIKIQSTEQRIYS